MYLKKLKRDKKGWLRIIEAFLAILIILGGVLYLISTNAPKSDISKIVYEKQKYILEGITKNESFREIILNYDLVNLNNPNNQKINTINAFTQKNLPVSWDFKITVCGIDDLCNPSGLPTDREVYSSEMIVTASKTTFSPKKLKLFSYYRA